MTKVRVAVADDEPDMREYFQKILPRLGFEVVSIAENGMELVEHCRTHHPDVIITDVRMPQLDGIEAAKVICESEPVPVILVSAHELPCPLEDNGGAHAMACLVKPVKQADLKPVIAIARHRFSELQALHRESGDWRQAFEDRKVIERAKAMLMKTAQLDEQAAFERLQSTAKTQRRKLAETANRMLQDAAKN